jgi:hypothetical protein
MQLEEQGAKIPEVFIYQLFNGRLTARSSRIILGAVIYKTNKVSDFSTGPFHHERAINNVIEYGC